ncbi:hypothetical protein [Commensalibacter nepenthis]|uniref:Uncharacterized protein n=1 Tax=Commensalibacter nepenthis TaxID=3043872 RepID=A0ABT6QAD8_9PROT|nr:hypothetical protein [Commensalibacter sp. TBRC 10068]MDI2113875.1 hypothetical protein [Commensalibacter sp. TBRC 10068]
MTEEIKDGLFKGFVRSTNIDDILKDGVVVEIPTEEAERLGLEDCKIFSIEEVIETNQRDILIQKRKKDDEK